MSKRYTNILKRKHYKVTALLLALIMLFGIFDIAAVAEDPETPVVYTDTLNEWIVMAVWNNDDTVYSLKSSSNETLRPKLTVKYYAENTQREYAPGEIQFVINGIDDIGRAKLITASTSTTQSDSKWVLTRGNEGQYILSNKNSIGINEVLSGGFEIMWSFNSREGLNNYSQTITPIFQVTTDDHTESINMNPLTFEYQSERDYYHLTIDSRKITEDEYEKVTSIPSSGAHSEYEDYNWYAQTTRFNLSRRARGANVSEYFIAVQIDDEEFTAEHYQELEVYTKSGKRIQLQPYTLSEITGKDEDKNTTVYGYYEFTNRKGDLTDNEYVSYIGVPKTQDGEADSIFENKELVTTGYLNVKYNDETEYVRMKDTSEVITDSGTDHGAITGENIIDNGKITNQTYGFIYGGMGYWHYKYNDKYEAGVTHTAPAYTNRLLSSEIYNNAVVEFTLVAGVNRSYGSTGSSASAANLAGSTNSVMKSTSTGADSSDDLDKGDTSIARDQKFYLIQGDDHIAVEQSNGKIRFLDDNEYDIVAVTVPKDNYKRNYTVWAAESQSTKYSNYTQVGSGVTSADKTFRLDSKYKAVYVKMEDVSGSYQSTIKVSVRFHLDQSKTPGVNPDGNIVNFRYLRVVYNDLNDGNKQKDYIGVSSKNFKGSFTDQIAAMDYVNHSDEIINNRAVDHEKERVYLYRGYSNVFIRKSITKLESSTVTMGNRTIANYIKSIASEYGGGYTFPITTSGTIQADNSGPLKKFSIHTLLPADLVPNEDLSEIRYGSGASDKWEEITLTASGTDTLGNLIDSSIFSDHVKYEVRKLADGKTVVSAYFDFSDDPLEIQKLTSVQINYPVRVDYLTYKTGSKEYTVYSYTSIQDTGVDEIKGSNIKYDSWNIDNVNGTVYVAESSSKINGSSDTTEWIDSAVKGAATYFSDGYTTTNTIKTFSNSDSINATNIEKTKYSYRLQMNVGSSVRDIVMYDNIEPENQDYQKENHTSVTIKSEWQGKLLSVDTSYLKSFKAKNSDPYDLQYTVFYSTEEYEEYKGIKNEAVESGNWKKMIPNADKTEWTVPADETGEARSVAVNINTGANAKNEYFKQVYLYAIINMQAPEKLPETGTNYIAQNAYHLSYKQADNQNIPDFMFSDITSVELREYLPIVTFTKTDSTNDMPLTGATFAIYKAKADGSGNYIKDGDTAVDSGTVNKLGKWTTDRLNYNTYYLLYETTAPQGYIQSETPKLIYIDFDTKILTIDGKVIDHVEDHDDEYEATIENERIPGTVQLTKKDSDDDSIENLAGAEFALYKSNGEQLYLKKDKDGEYSYNETALEITGTLVTSESGLKITGLPWGSYYITETGAPEGYIMDSTPWNFSVGKTKTDITIQKSNTEKTASINLTKYDASSGDPLSKAWYTLQKKSANGTWTNVYTGLRTNSTGEITVEELKFGTYRFVETNAPVGYALRGESDDVNTAKSPRKDEVRITDEEGYEVDGLDLTKYVNRTTGEITLDAKTVGLTIEVNDENERKKGTATISKTASSGLPLAGAKFDLYKVDDSGNGTLIKKDLTTGTDGKVTAASGDKLTEGLYGVNDLDWGNYYFVESYAPKGYNLDNTTRHTFEIKPDNVDVTQEVKATDEQKTGSIKLIKTAGAKVGDINENDPLKSAVFSLYTKDGVLVKLKQSGSNYECDDNGTLTTAVTDENGELNISKIPWGSYYLEEVQAPSGFALAEKVRFAVNADTCQAVQELDCEDPAMMCEIIINKKINDRVDSFGTPTFLFKIKNADGTKEWLKTITINSGLTGTTKLSVPAGTYTVEEIKVSRYTLTGVSWKITNAGEDQNKDGNNEVKATFELTSPSGATEGDTATVNFDNKLENYDKYGHTAAATNVVPKERKITGISVEYLDVVPVDLNKADSTFQLKSDSLVAYIIYDDGEKEEMTSEQKATLQFPDDTTMPTVSNTVNYVNSTQMINAKWTNGGKTYRTTFDVTIGSAQTTPTQKVIFKVDADNSCYFLNNGKRSSSNTVYYRDGAAVIGQYISPTFVDPSNTQATSWADALENGTTVATNEIDIINYISQYPDQTEFTAYLKLGRLVVDYTYNGTPNVNGYADGSVQEFIVPADGYYLLETWGASGGDGAILRDSENYANRTISSHGGHGGYSYANVYLTKGTTLYIIVGGQGYSSELNKTYPVYGGYNGGGNIYPNTWDHGSGGGMTHISLTSNPVPTTGTWDSTGTLVVAGGGGGADNWHSAANKTGVDDDGSGGYGGGEKGGAAYDNGALSSRGIGGGQVAEKNNSNTWTQQGKGQSVTSGADIGAGGGGWYGGLSSYSAQGGGGGGSGHVSLGDVSGGNQTAKVVSGATIGGNQVIPTYDGAKLDQTTNTMIGNIGSGHARITFTENEIPLSYSGQVQSFTADRSGYYKLEGWGAQGGSAKQTYDTSDTTSYEGGRGGYSTGMVYLEANQTIYYAVGGEGQSQHYVSSNSSTLTAKGGFNGGGNGYMGANVTTDWYGGGGGATHFALNMPTDLSKTGVLSDYASQQDDVLLVAGGGGGSYYYYNSGNNNLYKTIGGYGGGENGGEGVVLSSTNPQIPSGITIPGGGQTAPASNANYLYGTFGQGANAVNGNADGGGGGGWYGGAKFANKTWYGMCGGGGSGHVNYTSLINGKTIGGNETIPLPDGTTGTGNTGNGAARITYVGNPGTVQYTNVNKIQTFTAPVTGYYKLQAWGAQGGGSINTNDSAPTADSITNGGYFEVEGGRGGYSYGTVLLKAGQTIYIGVGGKGEEVKELGTADSNGSSYKTGNDYKVPGGFNGGGYSYFQSPNHVFALGSGGGATHFALTLQNDGTLANYENNKDDVLLVAGGGGGSALSRTRNGSIFNQGLGGYGGGEIGGNTTPGTSDIASGGGTTATGGTQDAGGYQDGGLQGANGSFGQGAQGAPYATGGGGGWYGGGGSRIKGGAGGSGHVNNDGKLASGYDAKTIGGDTQFIQPDGTYDIGHSGDGAAQVTLFKALETMNYSYTGAVQTFVAPKTGTYQLEVWGAQGGYDNSSKPGGNGGYSVGAAELKEGETLYVYVGQSGTSRVRGTGGGWNGGGNAGTLGVSGAGGGATDIRTVQDPNGETSWNDTTSLQSRIIVAGGGGGGGNGAYGAGGVGGGDPAGEGYTGQQAATSTSGYAFGYGQNRIGDGGGGGGGYYGGYMANGDQGAGGGSGYVNNDILSNAQTIAGDETILLPDGTTGIGNTGDGYARITLIG